jgi:NADPH:quinone reductase-like Zn-dependent oxidoreductase
MNAIRFRSFGSPDVLKREEVPTPLPGAGEVLVQLRAAALNHLDLFVRAGDRESKIPLPHIPGSDGAGVIAGLGAGVTGIKDGDRVVLYPGLSCGSCEFCIGGRENLCRFYRVLGTLEDGTCAEYLKVPASNLLPLPQSISFEDGAAFALVAVTAWHMLVTLAKVKKDDIVLIHGAGSGVGSMAIQIAKYFGARVITTAGSEEKLGKAAALGADDLINYQTTDFARRVRELTAKRGVDIVFEHIGGAVLQKSLTILTKGGTLVTCGATGDYLVNTDFRYVYFKHLSILGSIMGTRAELAETLKLAGEGKLRAVIDSTFPLADVADAHRRLESRKQFGKVVIKI